MWKRWWFIGGAGLLLLIVVAAIFSDADEDDVSPDSTSDIEAAVDVTAADQDDSAGDPPAATTVPIDDSEIDSEAAEDQTADAPADTSPSVIITTPPAGTASDVGAAGGPDAGDGPVTVGVAVMEDDDLVRVNSVTADVPAAEFFEPDPGNTVTAAEVEACGGDDGFNANSFYWTAFLDDNTAADNYLFGDDYETIGLKPGNCIRGVVTFVVPDGRTVASIVLTGQLFDETARWLVEGAIPVTERLQPVEVREAASLGEVVTFGADHTAVVRSVIDGAPQLEEFFGPEAGRQFTQIDVELCAGTEPLSVNPFYWLASTEQLWMGSSSLGGGTLDAIDVAAGQCVAGLVEIDLPEGSTTVDVVLTNEIFDEAARWTTQ